MSEQTEQVTTEETKQEETKTVADEQPAEEPESEDEEYEYTCPPEFDEREEMRKMFVGGLDKETTDDEFKELFSKYGEITDHIIIRKDNNKSDRLFGFVTFQKCDDLENCLLERPHNYKEKELDVKRAVPKGADDNNGHFKVKKLHVANIPTDLKVKELRRYLKKRHPAIYGKIEEMNFLKTKDDQGNLTTKNRGFGFITVSTEDFADRIAIGESKFILNGANMRISKAKPRNSEGYVVGGRGRGKSQNQGWGDDYGWGGYGGYGGYGYGGYGYNQGYDYYGGYPGGYGGGGYGPQRGGRGGGARFQPY